MRASSDDYLLAGGATKLDRLRLQARAWEPETEIMLDDPETIVKSFIVTQVWGRKGA